MEKPVIKILFINGSPRKNGNTSILIEEAVKGARELEERLDIRVTRFDFAGKNVRPCIGCLKCGEKKGCVLPDDFSEFVEKWLDADGVVYGYPVYHRGMTAQLKGAIDRLGHSVLSSYKKTPPRFLKACGVIVQGGSVHGGQEIAVGHMLEHILLMRCVPVAAEAPEAKVGVIGHATTWEKGTIVDDKAAMIASCNMGRRVAEMARMLQVGLDSIKDYARPGYAKYMK